MVDLTVPGLGRAIPLVAAVADRVPLHLVAATGYYTADVLPLYFQFHGPGRLIDEPDPLVEMFVRDIEEGIGGTPVRAGMIKVMTGPAGWTPDVERVMTAAATAHARTGVSDHDPLGAGDPQRPRHSRRSSRSTASLRTGSSSGTPATPRTWTTFASSWTTARRSGWTASAWSTSCRMTGGSPTVLRLLELGLRRAHGAVA